MRFNLRFVSFVAVVLIILALIAAPFESLQRTHAQDGEKPGPTIITNPNPAGEGGPQHTPSIPDDNCTGLDDAIIYDDGVWDIGTVIITAGYVQVQQFTPPYYPFTFNQVCLEWLDVAASGSTLNYTVVIYANAAGSPGALVASVPDSAAGIPPLGPVGRWYATPVSYTLASGSVFIGVLYDTSTAPGNNIFLPADDDSGGPGFPANYYSTNGGSTWSAGGVDAFMIRAGHINTAPTITSLTMTNDPINEFQTSGVTINFTDPDAADTHTYQIDWGDGTGAAGSLTSGSTPGHTFVDDLPLGTPSDVLTVSVTVCDQHNDCDTATVPITVNNLPPAFTGTTYNMPSFEGGVGDVSGSYNDPGREQTITFDVDWGDGSGVDNYAYGPDFDGNFPFGPFAHLFGDDSALVTITMTDDDTGVTVDSQVVNVRNVAPQVTGTTANSLPEGSSSTLSINFYDRGFLDTHNLSVAWNDPAWPGSVFYNPYTTGSTENHVYSDNGSYTAMWILADDDGGTVGGSNGFTITNVDPSFTTFPGAQVAGEGDVLDLTGAFAFSDPGYNTETFTYSIDWGDGTAADNGVPPIVDGTTGTPTTGTFSGSHTYADAAGSPYTVTVTVTDDDGGFVTDTFQVTVTADVLAVAKSFAPTNVGIGEPSTMTLTFLNPNGGTDLTNIVFTDTFPAGLEAVTPGTASGSCAPSGNTFNVTVGATSVTQSTTTIAAGDTCTVDVDVFSNTAGVYDNTVTGISADPAGASPDSNTASLTVIDALIFEKEFDDLAIDLDTKTTLYFTLTNTDAANVATNAYFSDLLPNGLQFSAGSEMIETPAECGALAAVTVIDPKNLDFTGGEIQPGTSCVISVEVFGRQIGNYTNAFEVFGSDLPINDATDTADISVAEPTGAAGTDGGEDTTTPEDHARAQAPLCGDLDGSTNPIIRADVPGGTVTNGGVYCRVINANGAYEMSYGPAEIGNMDVVNMGVLQAVDVFGMSGATPVPAWNSSVEVCLQGTGTFWYLGALDAPRVPQVLAATTQGGYTCAILFNAGTVVLTP